ncbi:MAG TPA: PLD nuclease N-terminal domain-containing protein [Dermatophilaceae bacterium]|nr:PLD nuclease N-terminal domain-containing protein [Dermatophilaceae bacterium]
MTAWADLSPGVRVALGALVVVQVVLAAIALWVLVRTPTDRLPGRSRWPWLALILLVNVLGPILFLALGRTPAPAEDPRLRATDRAPLPDERPEPHDDPTRRALDVLYDTDRPDTGQGS